MNLDDALAAIRTLLDPTILADQLEEHLQVLLEEGAREFDFNIEEALNDPSSRERLVNVWPEYYPPEDIEVVLRRWLAFTEGEEMCLLYFAALNPMLQLEQFWSYTGQRMDAGALHSPASAFWIETFFRHNPNATLALLDDPASWDEKYFATSAFVIWPMSRWLSQFQGRKAGDKKRLATRELLATWLEGSSDKKLSEAGATLRGYVEEDPARALGIRTSLDSIGEISDEKYFLQSIRLNNIDITSEHLAWALEVSCYLQMAHYLSMWDLAFFVFSAILKGQAGWGDPRITLDKFVAWYGLVVPEMQRLADLLGEPWSPPLETVL